MTDKLLAKLTTLKAEKTQIHDIRDKKGVVVTNCNESKGSLKKTLRKLIPQKLGKSIRNG